jgi:hypothetical protein
MSDLLRDKVIEWLVEAERHARKTEELLLVLHHKDHAELICECSAIPSGQTARDFLESMRVEVLTHGEGAIPSGLYDKREFKGYCLRAAAAQFHGHPIEVQARREAFEALCQPWRAYERARQRDGRMR